MIVYVSDLQNGPIYDCSYSRKEIIPKSPHLHFKVHMRFFAIFRVYIMEPSFHPVFSKPPGNLSYQGNLICLKGQVWYSTRNKSTAIWKITYILGCKSLYCPFSPCRYFNFTFRKHRDTVHMSCSRQRDLRCIKKTLSKSMCVRNPDKSNCVNSSLWIDFV